MRAWAAALALCACQAFAGRALAWNASGHMQIALLVYDALPERVRADFVQLLKEHPRYAQDFIPHQPSDSSSAEVDRWLFAFAATWPDVVRGQPDYDRGAWHYVNLRLRLERGKLSTCSAARASWLESRRFAASGALASIVDAIPESQRIIADPARPAADRAVALAWLMHLVGDAHQPLHGVALFTARRFPEGDRGGNEVVVRGRGSLHRVWDGLLGEETALAALDVVLAELRSRPHWMEAARRAADELSVERWIDESCALARTSVYVPAVRAAVKRVEANGRSLEKPEVSLGPAYMEAAAASARRRAAQAAGRLRALLLRLNQRARSGYSSPDPMSR